MSLRDPVGAARRAIDTLKSEPVYCLDDGIGCVQLVEYMGNDEGVVRRARVSFAADREKLPEDRVAGMIRFMMDNKHGTVFEGACVTFVIEAPLMVFREWHRHRTMAYNEWSARYSVLEPKFYIPSFVRHQVGKPGAYTFEPVDHAEPLYRNTRERILAESQHAYDQYQIMLDQGIAKEQARLVLPVNIYSKMYATASLRNWMKFLELRNSEHAMYEIRRYAEVVEEILHVLYPVTMAAFRTTGVAP